MLMPGENIGDNDSPFLEYLRALQRLGPALSPASGMKRTVWKPKMEHIMCIA